MKLSKIEDAIALLLFQDKELSAIALAQKLVHLPLFKSLSEKKVRDICYSVIERLRRDGLIEPTKPNYRERPMRLTNTGKAEAQLLLKTLRRFCEQ